MARAQRTPKKRTWTKPSVREQIRAATQRTGTTRAAAKPAQPTGYYASTHRPLQCLVFLLPFAAAYEVGTAAVHHWRPAGQPPDLAAQMLLQWFFSLFGATGYYLPGFALVAVLLAWHLASREPWRIDWIYLPGMLAEGVLLAIPLLAMNRFFDGQALAAAAESSMLNDLLLSVGAGIYEELVFRLIIISLLMLLLKDIGGMKQTAAVAFAVVISSLAFAAHHYRPVGSDTFAASEFAFRFLAGGYLAGIFVYRGFGIAVGCHVVYDVLVAIL